MTLIIQVCFPLVCCVVFFVICNFYVAIFVVVLNWQCKIVMSDPTANITMFATDAEDSSSFDNFSDAPTIGTINYAPCGDLSNQQNVNAAITPLLESDGALIEPNASIVATPPLVQPNPPLIQPNASQSTTLDLIPIKVEQQPLSPQQYQRQREASRSVPGGVSNTIEHGNAHSYSLPQPPQGVSTNAEIENVPQYIRDLCEEYDVQIKIVNGNRLYFLNCSDFPHGSFWTAVKDSGGDLDKFETILNDKQIFIGSPRQEALDKVSRVVNDVIRDAMIEDINDGNYASALLRFCES